MARSRFLTPVLLTASFAVASCGGGTSDEESSPSDAEAETTEVSTVPTTTEAPAEATTTTTTTTTEAPTTTIDPRVEDEVALREWLSTFPSISEIASTIEDGQPLEDVSEIPVDELSDEGLIEVAETANFAIRKLLVDYETFWLEPKDYSADFTHEVNSVYTTVTSVAEASDGIYLSSPAFPPGAIIIRWGTIDDRKMTAWWQRVNPLWDTSTLPEVPGYNDWTYEVLGVELAGVNALLKDINQFNDDPPAGADFIRVRFRMTNEGEALEDFISEVNLVGASGTIYEPRLVCCDPESQEISDQPAAFSGGSIEGFYYYTPKIEDIEDGNFLGFDPNINGTDIDGGVLFFTVASSDPDA